MTDLAGRDYWDRGYRERPGAPRPFDPRDPGLRGHWKRELHGYLQRLLAGRATRGQCLLEVGCGGSEMLPYFAREFGFRVAGLDYSPAGCALAAENLTRRGVTGDVICGDVFDPPASLINAHDVVVSFGVLEHFRDTTAAVAAFGRLLRPGGLMITSVPNMAGVTGSLQKWLDRSVYERHVPLNARRLGAAHEAAGLAVSDCRYLLALNLGVVNVNDVPHHTLESALKGSVLLGLRALTAGVWMAEALLGPLPANRVTSPYVVCAAEKPRA